MDSWDDRNGAPRGHGAARHVSRAVAERERGRRRLNTTTATVGVASLLAAGAVAAVLPGSTSKASTHSTGSSSTSTLQPWRQHGHRVGELRLRLELVRLQLVDSSSGSNSSNSSGSNSSNSSSSSSNLQAPVNQPVQSNGGGQVTSGGSTLVTWL